MSKFNVKNNVVTYEGAKAVLKDKVTAWFNNLMGNFFENAYYESMEYSMVRFCELTNSIGEELGWEFVAKGAVFARKEMGVRTASHVVAAILNNKKFDGKRHFFEAVCQRPDDAGEILSLIDLFHEKRSHACVRGIGDYISGLDEYQLTKYKMSSNNYCMYDIINLTHPKSNVVTRFMNGECQPPQTWEVTISNSALAPEERDKAWIKLVEENKLGYIALLRNLRNIINASGDNTEWVIANVVEQLIDNKKRIASKVYPYQIATAYFAIEEYKDYRCYHWIQWALSYAFKQACSLIDPVRGKCLVVLDVSGSMGDYISKHSVMSIKDVGAAYATMLVNSAHCDFIKFGTKAKTVKFDKDLAIFDYMKEISKNDNCGYGTIIDNVYDMISDIEYDKIFIFSDLQVMEPCNQSTNAATKHENYLKKYPNCQFYSFDLGHYATTYMDTALDNVHMFTGLSEKIFDFIKFSDNNELIDYIRNYQF